MITKPLSDARESCDIIIIILGLIEGIIRHDQKQLKNNTLFFDRKIFFCIIFEYQEDKKRKKEKANIFSNNSVACLLFFFGTVNNKWDTTMFLTNKHSHGGSVIVFSSVRHRTYPCCSLLIIYWIYDSIIDKRKETEEISQKTFARST